jgi:DNA-binding NarL/FixJ family response regulator
MTDGTRAAAERIRIAVADDHPVVRDGLIAMLETQPEFEVVGQAGSGTEAVALVERTAPDVLLLDLEMPGLDGVGVLRRLREIESATRAIVFTVFDTDDRIITAVEAGAVGYLLKGVPRDEVFNAVRVVKAGGSLLQPVVAARVLRHVASGGRAADPPLGAPAVSLTPREREVLAHLVRGSGNKQIAAALGVSERTVKFHVSAIFTKLGAGNRTEAVTRAVQAGLASL